MFSVNLFKQHFIGVSIICFSINDPIQKIIIFRDKKSLASAASIKRDDEWYNARFKQLSRIVTNIFLRISLHDQMGVGVGALEFYWYPQCKI